MKQPTEDDPLGLNLPSVGPYGEDADDSGAENAQDASAGPVEGDDIPFDQDLPCLRCGYNLRGLKPTGQCPECGANIRKALSFAQERILCLACMTPVHPSTAKCPNCGSPVHTSGALANYWKVSAHGVGRKTDEQEEIPKAERRKLPSPPPPPTISWIVCSTVALCVIIMSFVLDDTGGILFFGGIMIGLLLLFPAIFASMQYPQRRREHQQKIAAIIKEIDAQDALQNSNPNDN
jgi:hypothetical protein